MNYGNEDSKENDELENENKIHININSKKKPPSKNSKNNDEGEYVDYTEINN